MKNDGGYLEDMINEISRCQSFLRGITKAEFDRSHLHKYAVAKVIENIGEAASKLTPAFKDANADVGWSRLTRTRNELIHNYGIMDPDALWEAATNNLPKLGQRLSQIAAPSGNDDLGSPGSGSGPGTGRPDGASPTITKSTGETRKPGSSPKKPPPKASRRSEWER